MTESAKKKQSLWVEENHQDILRLHYRIKKTLFSQESDFQHIDIVETEGFGKMLFNDSLAMISERDEFVYHEMISHVALFVHPKIKRALVIGGGDGGTVREIIRHTNIEHCRLIEIDPLVVEGCKKHIPLTAKALDDPKVQVDIEDGFKFAATTKEKYDLIIVDSTDPIGPAAILSSKEFYQNLYRILNEDGIVVSQAQSPFYEIEAQKSLLKILQSLFQRIHLYNYTNLTYPGGLWSFSYATKGNLCPIGDFNPEKVQKSEIKFKYYNAAVHGAAFVFPQFQQEQLQEFLTPAKTV